MNYQDWLKQAVARLQASDSPKRDAEILLEHVTGKGRTFLLAFGETELTDDEGSALAALLARRATGEPIAYLVGHREFWSLPLAVSPATLIPRPDTECLVEHALANLPAGASSVLDLGTGTGAIALAIAHERPDCQVVGIDRQPDAVALASHNASQLGIANARFLPGDWFSPLDGQRFSLIVSNPPYIDEHDPHLSRGDVRFEPASALVAREAGLADLRQIIRQAGGFLLDSGWLLLEHGWQQGDAVRSLLTQYGFVQVKTYRDYGDNERVTLGQWPAGAIYGR
ncbi:peptide chain release factor N(5)-glutamine methyltransferase [Dickeya dadantii]|uniref:peptide chain release factor N(5)-glutamine methyltransferase n=1 Tax=Dickeya dadantii TaxID=204038 RepID=UPI0013735638|nr:peptide chain release factor N(5)-glutamine methyltransferase [Dickeya dadantii]NAT76006.1 peptide chain release factor N(5)-glutamine methyltransferase [Dickeya dadantii]NPE62062.1 peptide chain release factor N(5)-glutamine methyltransferase [Dickeya dadantii]